MLSTQSFQLEITPGLADIKCNWASVNTTSPLKCFTLEETATSWPLHHPPPFTPVEVLVVLTTLVKNYLKWWQIQLVDYTV